MAACGGSGGGSNNQNPNDNNPGDNDNTDNGEGNFGKYDGLIYYTNANDHGITDNGGKFAYKEGETVGFWLNYENNVFIGFALAKENMTITDLAINSQWVTAETAENIKSFLEGLDVDANPLNGVTITADERSRIQEAIDFTLPREKFIRQYAQYAEYIAGSTGATGNIGQTDATFNITLSKGIALYFPVDLLKTSTVTPNENSSTVLGARKWTDLENILKAGVYAVGLNPGVQTLTIQKTGYTMSFQITVVDPINTDDFDGTVINYLGDEPTVIQNVNYQDYLTSVEDLTLIEALTYLKIIFKPGEY